ncbi:DUF4956 domain-containing protein [Carnobacterium gallinarum]|uniref:DUF4956 domain-containing protein n=1 Tax=Carnobacterium gallinarum TaxID=2749 RepID=UPI00054F1040|nr:DUF4956 domain-containing protein [Carnobacterium gallinarum]
MLASILPSTTGDITVLQILLCTATSLILGIGAASVHMYRNVYTKSFIVTLAILPVLVQTVIMLVNGNLGTGVAVLGAFSLIRFRSVAGGAREISSIFWAMGIGLATGMGYLVYVALFSVIIGTMLLLLNTLHFGQNKTAEKSLKITIPENLDYTELFDDLFEKYTYTSSLTRVKTTNMGSLYELVYQIMLKDTAQEKNLIDEVRRRNGNLTIICGKVATNKDEL